MAIHNLKIDPQPFADLVSGAKTCEVRNDDRGFEVGDTVRFPGCHCRTISHIQRGYGLPDGLCVLSYAQASAAPEQEPFAYGLTLNGEARAVSLVATQWDVLEKHGAKTVCLYTHADPSEVERLRAELAESDKCVVRALNERDAALKQLAEAQAQLRDWYPGCGLTARQTMALRERTDAFLSATAQPADGVKS